MCFFEHRTVEAGGPKPWRRPDWRSRQLLAVDSAFVARPHPSVASRVAAVCGRTDALAQPGGAQDVTRDQLDGSGAPEKRGSSTAMSAKKAFNVSFVFRLAAMHCGCLEMRSRRIVACPNVRK